jgi:hypothetical protein
MKTFYFKKNNIIHDFMFFIISKSGKNPFVN